MLEVLFEDEHYVAINKPHGMLVHRSKIAKDVKVFALQEIRDQINHWVSPCHRLDRKTGGVLFFAKSEKSDRALKKLIANREVKKVYRALVRGWVLQDKGTIDNPLRSESGKLQEALTHFKVIDRFEIDKPVGKFNTGRFSLVEVYPETGRMHQIRRHFAKIRHYIINDKVYGDCKQNKFFEQELDIWNMLLHAKIFSFEHPFTKKEVLAHAKNQKDFTKALSRLKMGMSGLNKG